MKLPTIEYEVVQQDGAIIGLLSENFKNPSYEYDKCKNLTIDQLQNIRKTLIDKNYECNEVVRQQLTAYLLRNYYSALRDHKKNSMYAYNSKESFMIAPLHDYESSFLEVDMDTYSDPMLNYCFNLDSCEYLRNHNKYYEEYLTWLYSYNINTALNEVAKKNHITIPCIVRDYYNDFDNERREFMQHMGLRLK